MKYPARAVTTLLQVLLVGLLPLCLAPHTLIGGERDPAPPDGSERQRRFTLIIHDNRLSLQAQHASFKEVMEAVGQQLGIEVVARISPEERVTEAFEQLMLEEMLKRFRSYARIVYQTQPEGTTAPGRISKIYIFTYCHGDGQRRLAAACGRPRRIGPTRAAGCQPTRVATAPAVQI